MELRDNPVLRFGTATWDGLLLGFSGLSSIMGGVNLTVNLTTSEDHLISPPSCSPTSWVRPIRGSPSGTSATTSRSREHVSKHQRRRLRGRHLQGTKARGHDGTAKRTDLVVAFGVKYDLFLVVSNILFLAGIGTLICAWGQIALRALKRGASPTFSLTCQALFHEVPRRWYCMDSRLTGERK